MDLLSPVSKASPLQWYPGSSCIVWPGNPQLLVVFFNGRKATPLGLPPESFSNDHKLLISFHIVSSKSFSYNYKVQDYNMLLLNGALKGSFVQKLVNFLCANKIKFTIRTSFIISLFNLQIYMLHFFPFNLSYH